MLRRSLFFYMLAFLAGIYLAYFTPSVILVAPLLFISLLLFVLACFRKCRFVYFLLPLFFLVGGIHLVRAEQLDRRAIYPYRDEFVTVTAEVISEAKYSEKTRETNFTARVTELSFLKETVSLRENVRFSLPAGEKVPAYGETFRGVCLLSIPERSKEESFDYALYLKANDISFSGELERGTVEILGKFPLSFTEKLHLINKQCGVFVSEKFPKEAAGLVRAVALGDTSGMSDEFRQKLSVSGLSHMTAVSGMHVTVLISCLYAVLSILKRNKYRYMIPAGGAILLFMLFTGASPSVVRATVMSLLSLLAFFCFRRADGLTSLGVSAGVLVLINPFVAFDIGFMLSFAATLGILLFAKPLSDRVLGFSHLQKPKNDFLKLLAGMLNLLCVTFSAQLLIVPIASSLFGSISYWGFITNLLTSFLLPFILAGGLLVAFLGFVHPALSWPVAAFCYPMIKAFHIVVSIFGKWERGLLDLGVFNIFTLYVYGLFVYGLYNFLKRKYANMWVGFISVLLLLIIYFITPLI